MRTVIYYIIVFALFGGGWMLHSNKDSSKPYEIPYLSDQSVSLASFSFSSEPALNSGILPRDQWKAAMLGEWKIRYVYNGTKSIDLIEGKVTFNDDDTFDRRLTYKRYFNRTLGRVEKINKDLKFQSGGRVIGRWSYLTEGDLWVEFIEDCKESVVHDRDSGKSICDFFPKSEAVNFGRAELDFAELKLIEFNASRIAFTEENFDSDRRSTFEMIRPE